MLRIVNRISPFAVDFPPRYTRPLHFSWPSACILHESKEFNDSKGTISGNPKVVPSRDKSERKIRNRSIMSLGINYSSNPSPPAMLLSSSRRTIAGPATRGYVTVQFHVSTLHVAQG